MIRPLSTVIAGLSLALSSSLALAASASWDESVNGDLSNDRLGPTHIVLTPGTNSITSTAFSSASPAGDIDYYRLTVPPGSLLTEINVTRTTTTGLAFIALQHGATFTEPEVGTNVANLLGYTGFGPGNGTVGTNILSTLGVSAGAIDFTPPLSAGEYTFCQQETGAVPATSTLTFVVSTPTVIPIPRTAVALLAVGLVLLGSRIGRRRA